MIKNSFYCIVIVWLCSVQLSFSQNGYKEEADLIKCYSQEHNLNLYFFYPNNIEKEKPLPAIIFFFGGGWTGGSPEQFLPQAKHFSERGIVAVLADYRTATKNQTTPFDAVGDAKSAMRYLKKNAIQLKINPDKIVAGGGSAGGHLAASCALIDAYNKQDDDLSISPIPNALVLFNPVLSSAPGFYGNERIKDEYQRFSPLYNIRKNAPPTIIMLGTKDKVIPVTLANDFKHKMDSVGSRCDVIFYDGQTHSFFNFKNTEFYLKTLNDADDFLVSINYLKTKKK